MTSDLDAIDAINDEMHQVKALVALIHEIGDSGAADVASTDKIIVAGCGAIARIVGEKLMVVEQCADQLWEAAQQTDDQRR